MFVLSLLKTAAYKKIINCYDAKYGAVRANLTYEQLCKIRVPLISGKTMDEFSRMESDYAKTKGELSQKEASISKYLKHIAS